MDVGSKLKKKQKKNSLLFSKLKTLQIAVKNVFPEIYEFSVYWALPGAVAPPSATLSLSVPLSYCEQRLGLSIH